LFATASMADSLLIADTESSMGTSSATTSDATQTDVDDAARLKCQTAADEAACLEQERASMSDAVPPNSDIDATTTLDPDEGDTSNLGPATAGSPGVDRSPGSGSQY